MSVDIETVRSLLDPISQLALQVILILLAVGAIVKVLTKAWGPARQTIDWAERLDKLVAVQEKIDAVVTHELTPNDGGSVKDQVGRIDSSVEHLHARMRTGERRFAAIDKRMRASEKRIAALEAQRTEQVP